MGRLRRHPVVVGSAVVAVLVVIAGYELPRHGRRLGAPDPPFYLFTDPRVTWWSLLAAAGILTLAWWAPRMTGWTDRSFALGVIAVALASRVVLNISRDGPGELIGPLTGERGGREYLPTVPLFLDDPSGYLAHFPTLVDRALPVHPAGHPPGATILLAGLDWVGAAGAWPAAVMILVVGSLTAIPVLWLGRSLRDESVARRVVLVWMFAPSVLLYGATSMDAVFAACGALAAVLLIRWQLAAGAVVTAIASFLSYALLAVPVWVFLTFVIGGESRHRLIRGAVMVGLIVAGGYVLGYLVLDYDPIAAYHATKQEYLQGVASRRPYWFWLVGDPVAFLVGLGIPAAVLWLRGVELRDPPAVALAVTLLIAAASGFAKAEVERIWMFLIPFAAITVAARTPPRHLRLLLVALAGQALVVEVLFGTTW
jgi:hypothetical protein